MKEENVSKEVKQQVSETSPATPATAKGTSGGKKEDAHSKECGQVNLLHRPEDIALKGNDDQPSFFDQIYEEIENVIGGDNPNQFLCLTIPGQVLTAEDFAYDYKRNAEKNPTVEANESRLANKLFDPCRVTGADNGMTLPYQYRSALMCLPQN
ncbi:hypothetical protein [Porphyromonas crevioricanis]|uniref:hypothetical protein n=1 Tax=Porphyromonas crevioricanis TaxID=393921 RepID=UPI000A82B4C8|nr:hypothetical protein [Porphyromonas crevioricanis]